MLSQDALWMVMIALSGRRKSAWAIQQGDLRGATNIHIRRQHRQLTATPPTMAAGLNGLKPIQFFFA